MIRKISIQDVVPKHAAKGGQEEDKSTENDPNRRERDYLIERLTRKRPSASIAESPIKTKKRPPKKKRSGKKWFWLSLPLIIALLVLVVLQFMVSVTVTVKPKELNIPIDTKLIASLDATTSSNVVTYQIITLSATDSESVLATGTVAATKPQKASGQITIFNNYSAAPQTLISNTRFETTDGLIYRIQNTIKIPGFTVSGGKTLPGSLTVTVLSDQKGSKYNIDMTDFTIPGFKTDAGRYSKIFARSKTDMTGGSDGNSFGVSDAARQAAQTDIESRLQDNLLRQVQSQKTVNSVVFDSASKISYQHLADTVGTSTGQVVISEQGTISSVVFDKSTLGKQLLGSTTSTLGDSVEIHGIENLHFIAAVSSTSPVWQTSPFSFTLTGPLDVVGVVNTNKLLQDVLGVPRSGLDKVLSNYPGIDKANATFKPFWKSSFPTDASRIKIEIVK